MLKLFEPRCKHRHTRAEHPLCFPQELKGGARPNILVLDIETAPMEVLVWRLSGNNYIPPSNVINDYFILSWSYKWLLDKNVYGMVVSNTDVSKRNDKKILQSLWTALDEADIVIAHNGKNFDVKKINSRFLINGFPPPRPYEVIDTLQICRSIFGFSSNALNYLNRILNLDLKVETGGIELWKQCLAGNQKALNSLLTYNKNDVFILEELYMVLRPWTKSHPNVGLYMELDKPVCRVCGGTNLTSAGYIRTPLGKYESLRCSCGAVGRLRKNLLTKEQKDNIVI